MPPKKGNGVRKEAKVRKTENTGKRVNDGRKDIVFTPKDLEVFTKKAEKEYPEKDYTINGSDVLKRLNRMRLSSTKAWKETEHYEKFLCLIYLPAVNIRIMNQQYDATQRRKDSALAFRAALKRKEARNERNTKNAESYARRGVDVSISTPSF